MNTLPDSARLPSPSARALCIRSLAALATAALWLAPAGGQSLPEGPAVWRDVAGIVNLPATGAWDPRFTGPHVPSYRTTSDGRLAVNVKGVPRLTLLKPEKLDPELPGDPPLSLLHQPPGAYSMSWDDTDTDHVGYLGGSQAAAEAVYNGSTDRFITHGCLWNDALPTSNAQGDDEYRVKILAATVDPAGGKAESIRLFVTPVRVVVSSPKTRDAAIVSVTQEGPTLEGPAYDQDAAVTRRFEGVAFEPTIAGDGRLIVLRIGSENLPVGPDGSTVPASVDIVYSYYEGGDSADPTRWLDVYPIAHANHDSRVSGKFGFARYPLRDPRGQLIPDWEDLGGSYPWIDRAAKNLFFTTIDSRLHTLASNWREGRYALEWLAGDPNAAWGAETRAYNRGVAFVGQWSRGKTILLDTLHNDMDYAVGNSEAPPASVGPQQRLVSLFQDGGAGDAGKLLLGYGFSNADQAIPPGENANTAILESIENRLNYKSGALPIAPRDVVWYLQNGKHTDQLAFDAYLDPDALVVATMAGLLRFPADVSGTERNHFEYDDGWDPVSESWGLPGQFPIRLQNAATAHHRWFLPAWGDLLHDGAGRLEPAATGGVRGKGLWLDEGIGLRYAMPSQAGAPSGLDADARTTYVGLFVDCRFPDDGADRLLLSFPDGSRLLLRGRRQVLFDDGAGALHFATLPDPFDYLRQGAQQTYEFLPQRGWCHLGLRIEDQGHRVTLLLNGLPFSRWEHPQSAIFGVQGGDLIVGDPGAAWGAGSFRGWIDDLEVFLRDMDPESACNHAAGTLVGVQPTAPSDDFSRRFAESFPAWTHGELSAELRARGEDAYDLYACFHDYSVDNAVHPAAMPADADSLAEAVHFPEGPLFFDAPRPDTSSNRFRLACHNSGEAAGLGLSALDFEPQLQARYDPRRQPMQPPALLSGFIPAGVVNAGAQAMPASDLNLMGTTRAVDSWLLPERGSQTSTLGSAFVVAGGTGEALVELDAASLVQVDPAVLGADTFSLQANLDSAQGWVELSLGYPPQGGGHALLVRATVESAPYTVFKRPGGPFEGRPLAPGLYRLKVTPQGAATSVFWFEVLGNAPRRIAGYRDDFQPGSPASGWFYAWNQDGPVESPARRLTLNWDADESRYTETGLDWHGFPSELGWGSLDATGGWPGEAQNLPAIADDRFVMAGYRVRSDGFLAIQGLDVTLLDAGSGGVEVKVLHDAGGPAAALVLGASVSYPGLADLATARFPVVAGDLVWVALGPDGDAAFDPFELDFEVWFNEEAW